MSDFPTMALVGPDCMLEDIYTSIKQKGHRLGLVFGDLCNSIPSTRSGIVQEGEILFKSVYLFDN